MCVVVLEVHLHGYLIVSWVVCDFVQLFIVLVEVDHCYKW